ncbi:MAG: agmatinase [Deltaproteobacteria bacterium]|nr:MAG: agmatinase [Deltaproteobacteria bacterium]
MKSTKKQIQKGSIGILGIPFDQNSSFQKGPSLAPDRIRESYFSTSSNLWSEKGLDLGSIKHLYDLGDINFKENIDDFNLITDSVKNIIDQDCYLICLGGDHSVTFPIIKAHAQKYRHLNILHFDAHPDLYDSLDGNIHSHACPFARIMEKKLAARLVQIGIRTMNGHQREQAEKFGVEVNEIKNGDNFLNELEFEGPVYISLDLDCLDPAFAPGVSHHEPGGMTTRQVIDIIHHLKGKIIGADIVEYNPDRDLHSMTSMVAAKLLKEIIAKIYEDTI